MTVERETVVVTGLGASTPLGGDAGSTWAAMLAGRSGVRRLTEPGDDDGFAFDRHAEPSAFLTT